MSRPLFAVVAYLTPSGPRQILGTQMGVARGSTRRLQAASRCR